MIGLPEILILLVIVLVVVGYKRLPQFGRTAGQGLRSAGESARELSTTVGDKFDEKIGAAVDPAEIGRTAGRGVREARELKAALTSLPEGELEAERLTKPEGASTVEGSDEDPKSTAPMPQQS